MLLDKSDHPI